MRWPVTGSGPPSTRPSQPGMGGRRKGRYIMASLNPVAQQIDSELQAITAWLQRPGSDHFLVTSHVNPDGDGLASMLACGGILRRLGKQAWLVTDGFLSPRYEYLPQIDTVVSYQDGLEAELAVANVMTVDVPYI